MIEYPHKRIQILSNFWDIYIVPKTHPRLLKSWGVTHFDNKEIYITNHLSERNFKWTLAHELLHAHFDELGFHSMLLEKLHRKKNEQLVDDLAKVLYPLMRQSVFQISKYQMKGREKE